MYEGGRGGTGGGWSVGIRLIAGEELDLRPDIGGGRMGPSSLVWLVGGKGYPDNWDCKAGGLEGGTGTRGNEGAWVYWPGEGDGKEGNWGTGGGISK